MYDYNPRLATHGNPKERLYQRIWEVVRFVMWGVSPWFARRWRCWWFRLFGGSAGAEVSLGRGCRLDFPWNMQIGEFSSVADGALVRASVAVRIGKDVCISEDVKILTASHDLSSPHFDLVQKPVVIENGVWIAMGAIILPGVTVGEGAVVAAGAVVTKAVEPWTVVGGNPAKEIKKRVLKG